MSTTSAPTMDRRNTPGPYGEPNADVNATSRNLDSDSKNPSETQSQQQTQKSTQSLKPQQSQSQPQTDSQQKNQSQTQPGQESLKEDRQKPAPTTEGGSQDKSQEEGDKDVPPGEEEDYPEQLHAGKLEGYGPEYGMQNRTVRITFSSSSECTDEVCVCRDYTSV